MARSYYSDWKNQDYSCPQCGWSGRGSELRQGGVYEVCVAECCPACGEELAVFTFPTLEEAFADWDRVPTRDRELLQFASQRHTTFEHAKLRAPDQLPDIPGAGPFVLVWDLLEVSKLESFTVIRCKDEIIWREPAVYQGEGRFEAIATILAERYGPRLLDLEPTAASELNLLGDKLSAEGVVQRARERIRAQSHRVEGEAKPQ